MPGSEQLPDIDPTVDQHMEAFVDGLISSATPSKTFGDETVIDSAPKGRLLPGETPQEAHTRLQAERQGEL